MMSAAEKTVDEGVKEAVERRGTDLPAVIPLQETDQLKIENAALRVDLSRARLRDAQRDIADAAHTQMQLMQEALTALDIKDPEKVVRNYSYDAERKLLVRVVRPA